MSTPRRGWNTEKLLKEALRGTETKLVQLYDLSPVLEEILETDVLLLGSPIYFGDITGQMVSFIERLGFPLLSY